MSYSNGQKLDGNPVTEWCAENIWLGVWVCPSLMVLYPPLHLQLAPAHPTSLPVPVGAASPSPGPVTWTMTAAIARMNLPRVVSGWSLLHELTHTAPLNKSLGTEMMNLDKYYLHLKRWDPETSDSAKMWSVCVFVFVCLFVCVGSHPVTLTLFSFTSFLSLSKSFYEEQLSLVYPVCVCFLVVDVVVR